MKIAEALSTLSLRPMIEGASGGSAAVDFWGRQAPISPVVFGTLLQRAADQAWKAVEVALAGPAWWERAKVLLQPGEDTAIGERVQAFLDSVALADPMADWRRRCLTELHSARQRGLLSGAPLGWESLRSELQETHGAPMPTSTRSIRSAASCGTPASLALPIS